MRDRKARFEKWKASLGDQGRFLTSRVIAIIVPELERHGFVWYSDYAAGLVEQVSRSTLPLQARQGEEWPTVEIQFDSRDGKSFGIAFAALPLECREAGRKPIARQAAVVVNAPVWFLLCKGRKGGNNAQFGIGRFSVQPYRRMEREVQEALSLLPVVFSHFENRSAQRWLNESFGYVDDHILLVGSWRIYLDRFEKK